MAKNIPGQMMPGMPKQKMPGRMMAKGAGKSKKAKGKAK